MMSQAEIERLISYMPIIMRAPDVPDWSRQFAISIVARTKRGAFTPTEKQSAVMAKIVTEFLDRSRDDEPLIERGA